MIDASALIAGLDLPEVALTVNRVALGVFFTFSGYHKLFNPKRHATIVDTMAADRIPFVGFNCWFVPSVEFAGGMGLVVGLLAPLAAVGLFIVCCVATLVDGLKRVKDWNPIDWADYADDVLYLPEVLYAIMLITVMVAGSGPASIDAIILRWL